MVQKSPFQQGREIAKETNAGLSFATWNAVLFLFGFTVVATIQTAKWLGDGVLWFAGVVTEGSKTLYEKLKTKKEIKPRSAKKPSTS